MKRLHSILLALAALLPPAAARGHRSRRRDAIGSRSRAARPRRDAARSAAASAGTRCRACAGRSGLDARHRARHAPALVGQAHRAPSRRGHAARPERTSSSCTRSATRRAARRGSTAARSRATRCTRSSAGRRDVGQRQLLVPDALQAARPGRHAPVGRHGPRQRRSVRPRRAHVRSRRADAGRPLLGGRESRQPPRSSAGRRCCRAGSRRRSATPGRTGSSTTGCGSRPRTARDRSPSSPTMSRPCTRSRPHEFPRPEAPRRRRCASPNCSTRSRARARRAGTPAHFLRLQGCDVGCRWCDTHYTWDAGGGRDTIEPERRSPSWRRWARPPLLVVTGGEPLAHAGHRGAARRRARALAARRGRDQRHRCRRRTRTSACTTIIRPSCRRRPPRWAETWAHARAFAADPNTTFKLVVGDAPDEADALRLLAEHELPRDRTMLMPEGLTDAALRARALALAETCQRENLRLSPAAARVAVGREAGRVSCETARRPALGRARLRHVPGVGARAGLRRAPRWRSTTASATASSSTPPRASPRALGVARAPRGAHRPVARSAARRSPPTSRCPRTATRRRWPRAIPVTYVPARNTVFLAVALGLAEMLGAADLVAGMNAIDYSGYPDCRPEFVRAFESLAALATRAGVEGARFTRAHAAHGARQGRHHPARRLARRGLRAHALVLRSRRPTAAPAAAATAAGCARGASARPASPIRRATCHSPRPESRACRADQGRSVSSPRTACRWCRPTTSASASTATRTSSTSRPPARWTPRIGWLVDFGEIAARVEPVLRQELDHRLLNDVPGLENPTSEVLCRLAVEPAEAAGAAARRHHRARDLHGPLHLPRRVTAPLSQQFSRI